MSYISEAMWSRLFELIEQGETVERAAAEFGFVGRTVYRHAKGDPVLQSRLKAAIATREANRERVGCGTRTRYNAGCRCSECRAAHRYAARRLRKERLTRDIPATVAHGNSSTYSNWACRCGPCSVAHSAAMVAERAARIAAMRAGSDRVPHGTASGYEAWDCRCTPCGEAASIARRNYRAAMSA